MEALGSFINSKKNQDEYFLLPFEGVRARKWRVERGGGKQGADADKWCEGSNRWEQRRGQKRERERVRGGIWRKIGVEGELKFYEKKKNFFLPPPPPPPLRRLSRFPSLPFPFFTSLFFHPSLFNRGIFFNRPSLSLFLSATRLPPPPLLPPRSQPPRHVRWIEGRQKEEEGAATGGWERVENFFVSLKRSFWV